MKKGKIFIFCAPSGSGKTTIVRRVLAHYENFGFSVSATTRDPRETECEGIDYYFLSVDDFEGRIRDNEFLEYEEVYPGRYYGTLKSEVRRMQDEGRSVVFDVDVKGGISIKKHFGDEALAFFIRPPDIATLRARLEARGTESAEEIDKRVAKADYELGFAGHFDAVILNDDLETAVSEVFDRINAFLEAP